MTIYVAILLDESDVYGLAPLQGREVPGFENRGSH